MFWLYMAHFGYALVHNWNVPFILKPPWCTVIYSEYDIAFNIDENDETVDVEKYNNIDSDYLPPDQAEIVIPDIPVMGWTLMKLIILIMPCWMKKESISIVKSMPMQMNWRIRSMMVSKRQRNPSTAEKRHRYWRKWLRWAAAGHKNHWDHRETWKMIKNNPYENKHVCLRACVLVS